MLEVFRKIGGFRKEAVRAFLSSGAPQEVDSSAPDRDPKIAFEAAPAGMPDAPKLKMLYPTRTRQKRVEPEAIVFVVFYEDFNKAVRFIQLHGKMKAEYGHQIPMFTVDYVPSTRCYDEVLRIAAEDAHAFLYAIRNPVECPVVDDSPFELPASTAPAPSSVPAAPASPKGALAEPQPMLTEEGEFQACGQLPWQDPKDSKKRGKPSFCVVLRQADSEKKLWGSDLERAIREAGVIQGDKVRLTKYPKVRVNVPTAQGGNRVVSKNIWTCERL